MEKSDERFLVNGKIYLPVEAALLSVRRRRGIYECRYSYIWAGKEYYPRILKLKESPAEKRYIRIDPEKPSCCIF